mgnify:CR=1 FL=1
MDSVRTGATSGGTGVRSGLRRVPGVRPHLRAAPDRMELLVLDLVYVLGVIVLFVLVGLTGKAVEGL